MDTLKTVFALLFSFHLVEGMTTPKVCPQFYYLDHGTHNCEFCCIICCDAPYKRTVGECETECPEYLQKLQDEDVQKIQKDTQQLQTQQKNINSKESIPLNAQLTIILGIVCILLLLLVLMFVKRKAIVTWCQQKTPDTQYRDAAAAGLLQQGTVMPQVAVDISDNETVTAATSGVPETHPPSEGEGNSWHIFQPSSAQVSSAGSQSVSRNIGRKPVPESNEGQHGHKDHTLLSNASRSFPATVHGLYDEDDTELKTFHFQPSLSSLNALGDSIA